MDSKLALAIAGLAITMIVGFTKIIASQARLEFKVDLMWSAYLRGGGPGVVGGKRFHDPPATADDDGRGNATDE